MKQKRMNKKIMLGSIVAVVIIVLTAFTSVVGFQTTKSTIIKGSPLFSVRTQRATNTQDSKTITSEYIGKRNPIAIPFPPKNTASLLFQNAVDGISTMDDLTFNKFLDAAINKLHQSNKVKDEDLLMIRGLFQFVRKNPEEAKKYPFDLKKHSYTGSCPPPTFDETPEWCFTLFVILVILIVTSPIWFPIYALYVFKENFFMNLSYRNLCLTLRPACD